MEVKHQNMQTNTLEMKDQNTQTKIVQVKDQQVQTENIKPQQGIYVAVFSVHNTLSSMHE